MIRREHNLTAKLAYHSALFWSRRARPNYTGSANFNFIFEYLHFQWVERIFLFIFQGWDRFLVIRRCWTKRLLQKVNWFLIDSPLEQSVKSEINGVRCWWSDCEVLPLVINANNYVHIPSKYRQQKMDNDLWKYIRTISLHFTTEAQQDHTVWTIAPFVFGLRESPSFNIGHLSLRRLFYPCFREFVLK